MFLPEGVLSLKYIVSRPRELIRSELRRAAVMGQDGRSVDGCLVQSGMSLRCVRLQLPVLRQAQHAHLVNAGVPDFYNVTGHLCNNAEYEQYVRGVYQGKRRRSRTDSTHPNVQLPFTDGKLALACVGDVSKHVQAMSVPFQSPRFPSGRI